MSPYPARFPLAAARPAIRADLEHATVDRIVARATARRFPLFVLAAALLTAAPARAAIIVFDFNSLADGASNTSVKNYMQGVLNSNSFGGTVALSGASGERDYTGDNHCVGPVAGSSVAALTLGNTDAGVQHAGLDTFLTNHDSDRITITFSQPIYEVSFDYQIFPNAQVPDGTTVDPAQYPDFTFQADGVQIIHSYGILPGTFGTLSHSPNSGPVGNEKAPQLLAHSTVQFFPTGATKLEFIDWPVLIGIDNLKFNTVPEPSSLVILALGVGGLALAGRRRLSAC